MPTLLQICVEGNTGSTGRIAEEIGNLAISQGWASYIAHGRFSRPSKSKIIKIGSCFDVFIHGLQTRFFDRHCLGSRQATIKLVRKMKMIKPDIIHLHHLHGYYINIKILFDYLATAAIPVVWTFHDCWSITGHCAHFNFIGCDKWEYECYKCPQKRRYPASWFFDRSKKNFHLKKSLFMSPHSMTIVPVSNWLDTVIERSFMGRFPRQIIYNGVDINIFNIVMPYFNIKAEKDFRGKHMILGVASTWDSRKGLNDFIDLAKLLDKDTFIVLVGLNKAQIKKLPSNIIGLARTENQLELRDLYSSSDLYMNLSVEETFGLTIAEAMACGTPSVVYNATACPEIIDSYTGLVVKKNDINGLLDAVKTIRNNSKEFYSNACRERAIKFFNKNDQFLEYIALYNKLLIKKNTNKN